MGGDALVLLCVPALLSLQLRYIIWAVRFANEPRWVRLYEVHEGRGGSRTAPTSKLNTFPIFNSGEEYHINVGMSSFIFIFVSAETHTDLHRTGTDTEGRKGEINRMDRVGERGTNVKFKTDN
jgi:hypothetical protein